MSLPILDKDAEEYRDAAHYWQERCAALERQLAKVKAELTLANHGRENTEVVKGKISEALRHTREAWGKSEAREKILRSKLDEVRLLCET